MAKKINPDKKTIAPFKFDIRSIESGAISSVTYTYEALDKLVADGLAVLQARIDHNKAIATAHQGGASIEKMPYYKCISTYYKKDGLTLENLPQIGQTYVGYRLGSNGGSYKTATQIGDVNGAIRGFENIYKKCKLFLYRLYHNSLKPGDTFITALGSPARWTQDQTYYTGVWVKDDVVCDKCERTVTVKQFEAHQKSKRCHDLEQVLKLKAAGYVEKYGRYDGSLHHLAVEGHITGCKLVPTDYRVFVPTWMVEAEALFKKNGSQYAGMELDEFVKTCSPDELKKNEVIAKLGE